MLAGSTQISHCAYMHVIYHNIECVLVCVYIYVCVCIHTYIRTYENACVHVHVYMNSYVLVTYPMVIHAGGV